ncbi:unnamed protein product [Amoebophrya sp. A25]|nr:unnamed protein product [Amoebophrya sp. A25]|eukprot:GSA25T00021806001.1
MPLKDVSSTTSSHTLNFAQEIGRIHEQQDQGSDKDGESDDDFFSTEERAKDAQLVSLFSAGERTKKQPTSRITEKPLIAEVSSSIRPVATHFSRPTPLITEIASSSTSKAPAPARQKEMALSDYRHLRECMEEVEKSLEGEATCHSDEQQIDMKHLLESTIALLRKEANAARQKLQQSLCGGESCRQLGSGGGNRSGSLCGGTNNRTKNGLTVTPAIEAPSAPWIVEVDGKENRDSTSGAADYTSTYVYTVQTASPYVLEVHDRPETRTLDTRVRREPSSSCKTEDLARSLLSVSNVTNRFPETSGVYGVAQAILGGGNSHDEVAIRQQLPGIALREFATEGQQSVWLGLSNQLLQVDLTLWPYQAGSTDFSRFLPDYEARDDAFSAGSGGHGGRLRKTRSFDLEHDYLNAMERLRHLAIAEIPGNLGLLFEVLEQRMPFGGAELLQIIVLKARLAVGGEGQNSQLLCGVLLSSYIRPLGTLLGKYLVPALATAASGSTAAVEDGSQRRGPQQAQPYIMNLKKKQEEQANAKGTTSSCTRKKSSNTSAKDSGELDLEALLAAEGIGIGVKDYSSNSACTSTTSQASARDYFEKDEARKFFASSSSRSSSVATATTHIACKTSVQTLRQTPYHDTSSSISPAVLVAYYHALATLLSLGGRLAPADDMLKMAEICVDLCDFLNNDAEVRMASLELVLACLEQFKGATSTSTFCRWLLNFEVARSVEGNFSVSRSVARPSCSALTSQTLLRPQSSSTSCSNKKSTSTSLSVSHASVSISTTTMNSSVLGSCQSGGAEEAIARWYHETTARSASALQQNFFYLMSTTDPNSECREKAAIILHAICCMD